MKDINEVLEEYSTFINRIYKYTFIIAAIFEVLSLPIFGLSLKFLWGLGAGTCVAILNFHLLAWTCKKIVYGGKGVGLSIIGYLVRMLIYGASYYGCAKVDLIECGFGCIAGFLTIKAAILYLHAFRGWLAERKKQAEKLALKKQAMEDKEREEED